MLSAPCSYAYIAQLIDLGDPELESFAAFAKLLAKRLNGVPVENVDLRGITVTGYDIKARDPTGGGDDDESGDPNPKSILHPVGQSGSRLTRRICRRSSNT